ncbi:MAG: nucleotide exchange factor GrpE [Planctomycetota bacterium]|nr:MAG: nucleotide exchange factor GrpE [Planctomycetota bacterium]
MKMAKEKDEKTRETKKQAKEKEAAQAVSGTDVETLDIMISPDRLARLELAAAEAEKYRDLALRARADYDNLRKRVERDAEESRDRRLKELFESALPALESFILAFEQKGKWSEDSMVDGLHMAFDQLMEVFKRFGLERMETVGKKFDPAFHEVVETVKEEGRGPNEIVRELSPGFTFRGRTLKPSKVVVSTGAAKEE